MIFVRFVQRALALGRFWRSAMDRHCARFVAVLRQFCREGEQRTQVSGYLGVNQTVIFVKPVQRAIALDKFWKPFQLSAEGAQVCYNTSRASGAHRGSIDFTVNIGSYLRCSAGKTPARPPGSAKVEEARHCQCSSSPCIGIAAGSSRRGIDAL